MPLKAFGIMSQHARVILGIFWISLSSASLPLSSFSPLPSLPPSLSLDSVFRNHLLGIEQGLATYKARALIPVVSISRWSFYFYTVRFRGSVLRDKLLRTQILPISCLLHFFSLELCSDAELKLLPINAHLKLPYYLFIKYFIWLSLKNLRLPWVHLSLTWRLLKHQ